MRLSSFTRRLLGNGSFPRLEGQELPDPVVKGPDIPVPIDNQVQRDKALGKKPRPDPKP